MSNIEIIQDFINEMRYFGLTKDTAEVVNELENVLLEREQDKKRIQDLESKLKEANKQLDLDYVDKNYIPVQKVIDKMEKLNKEIKNGDEIDAIFKIKQQQVLQELLEDK